ncbi:hypothetical protein GH714_000633 [Hevea brasiliensis]|uniref:Ubiquitin-like domain-containing protein n=1 Tax=Hevea brasiliensis TaxID=3981 RepID=A0A6A6LU47_HEVBR|nr:uncharacterized protein LOC131176077 isoform X2 [Hevea brasiliensis]KAF2304941.1 hypothetical protein GH714_000633 [Hevea brasiliensis]
MEVTVVYPEGNFSLMIPGYDQNPTILHVKQRIQQLIHVEPQWQGLSFNGESLRDSIRVQDYGIEQGSVIFLIRVSLVYEALQFQVLITEQTKGIFLKDQAKNYFGLAIEEQVLFLNGQVLEDLANVGYYPNINIIVHKTYSIWILGGVGEIYECIVHPYMNVLSLKLILHHKYGIELTSIKLKKPGSNWFLTDQTTLWGAGIRANDAIHLFY